MTAYRPALISVSAYLSLLQQDDYELKEEALKMLLPHVNIHWSEIANHINEIIDLYDNRKFVKSRKLVAILLAKLYFNLRNHDVALIYAMRAQQEFKIDDVDEFTEVIVNKCIENYITIKRKLYTIDYSKYFQMPLQHIYMDQQQAKIVERIIEYNFKKKDYNMILGFALQTYDVESIGLLLQVINFYDLIKYVLPYLDNMQPKFKTQLAEEINSKFYKVYDFWFNAHMLNNVFIFERHVNGYKQIAELILELIRCRKFQYAYQLAYEVSEVRWFARAVFYSIEHFEDQNYAQYDTISKILKGEKRIEYNRLFLTNEAKIDHHYEAQLKKAATGENSVLHQSAIFSLFFLRAFTEDDSYFEDRDNVQNREWAAQSTHWAKFATVASIAFIWKNDLNAAGTRLMAIINHKNDYFMNSHDDNPEDRDPIKIGHYTRGGAIFGLGLAFFSSMKEIIIEKITAISKGSHKREHEDVILHATYLALGLVGFGSSDDSILQELSRKINVHSSLIGEAACIGLGLACAGRGYDNVPEFEALMNCIEETQHQKVRIGASLGIALLMMESQSKKFMQQIEKRIEKSSNFRLTLPLYLSTAFFKTSNSEVIEKLLQMSNDINDEIKRAAVTAIGFVMYHDQHLVTIIKLLIYSYNTYIKYGCIMALAVGAKDKSQAIELIFPLLKDSSILVQQAAFIGLALLMQVSTNDSQPRLKEFRQVIDQIISKGYEEASKMGALLAIGILDIGGKNMVVSLTTEFGIPKLEALAGMLMFLNYWNWFPYINFLLLTLTPSGFVAVTRGGKVPKNFTLACDIKPSMFEYPTDIKKEEEIKIKKEAMVELSTTWRAKIRESRRSETTEEKIFKRGRESLVSPAPPPKERCNPFKKSLEEWNMKPKEQKQGNNSILSNPCRVTQKQHQHIFRNVKRYRRVFPDRKTGILVVIDDQPTESDNGEFRKNMRYQQQRNSLRSSFVDLWQ